MLHAIELGHATWPKAILYGVVNVLAKNDGAAPVDRFRPVVIFSVIYRTRAVGQSSLKTIASLAHSEDGRGSFMPGCEPSQLWLVLQAEIEQTLQVHGDLWAEHGPHQSLQLYSSAALFLFGRALGSSCTGHRAMEIIPGPVHQGL